MKGTLAIKRKTDTKQAIGYTWILESVSLDEINQRIVLSPHGLLRRR